MAGDLSAATYSDGSTRTALHAAAHQGHDVVLGLLLEHGAEVSAQANNEATPLHAAARGGHTECGRTLLAAGGSR